MMRALVTMLLVATGLATAAPSAKAAGKALIIGIDAYPFAKPLVGSAVDARSMRDFAVGRWGFSPGDVKLLLDGEATRAAILDALDRWLVAGTKPGDSVLFYFSGHGYHVPDRNGDERANDPADDQDEVLVAADGRLHEDGRYEGFVIDDEIGERLQRLKDRKVVMIFDSCHSGTMTRGMGNGPGGLVKTPDFPVAGVGSRALADNETTRGQQRIQPDLTDGADNAVAFFAVASTELAHVNERVRPMQGVFTEAFLRGAAGAADANRDGVVSLSEIQSFVRQESRRYCENNPCASAMTPFVEAPDALMGRDLITLARAPTLPLAALDTVGPAPVTQPVAVTVSPAGPIRIGQDMRISVTAPIDGTLVLVDLAPGNTATLRFPNNHSERAKFSRRVKAGQTIRIPDRNQGFDLEAEGPVGRGRILALVIKDEVRLDRVNSLLTLAASAGDGFAPLTDPLGFLGAISQALIQPWTGELTTRGVAWAMGYSDYEIVGK